MSCSGPRLFKLMKRPRTLCPQWCAAVSVAAAVALHRGPRHGHGHGQCGGLVAAGLQPPGAAAPAPGPGSRASVSDSQSRMGITVQVIRPVIQDILRRLAGP